MAEKHAQKYGILYAITLTLWVTRQKGRRGMAEKRGRTEIRAVKRLLVDHVSAIAIAAIPTQLVDFGWMPLALDDETCFSWYPNNAL